MRLGGAVLDDLARLPPAVRPPVLRLQAREEIHRVVAGQAALCGRWLRSGDIARQDAQGHVFLVGRIKDVIIRSGFNVYPAEVEAALNVHPAVAQSAVVGREVERNEEVIAFVQPKPRPDARPCGIADLPEGSHLALQAAVADRGSRSAADPGPRQGAALGAEDHGERPARATDSRPLDLIPAA
jgi:acyl-CoA synthetase (AMP-forming)/AMP-acid ligase II